MFQGFFPESFDFLWGIRMNNNRDWFLSHKGQYVDKLYEPMKALGQALFQPFLDRPGMVLKVSRIYRDARLHHPDPYKESLWLCIRRDGRWWGEAPCLFLEIRPEGVSFGFLLLDPKAAAMMGFRREIAARPETFLDLLEAVRTDTGIPVTGECYKREKPAPDPRLAPCFSWKGKITCIRTLEPGPELFSPALQDTVAEMFRSLLPLYDYFDRILP